MTKYVQISSKAEADLIEGSRDPNPVRGLTHNFYRYPARFSGSFARAAIEAFTQHGDLVLDPHVGGGTSVVEALALGRNAIGVDISSLAEFVTTVKTTVYSEKELAMLQAWSERLPGVVNIQKWSICFEEYFKSGYYKHLDHPTRWRVRKAIEQALGSAIALPGRLEDFGRCVVLRAAQVALDGRKTAIAISAMRKLLGKHAAEMVEGARLFRDEVMRHSMIPSAQILNRNAAGVENDERLAKIRAPRLVLTSPPYPGVHVLYHRWQVGGGRETGAPYWIANKLDGSGAAYYTMGDRKSAALSSYFKNVEATMGSVAQLCAKNTIIVQMLFSEPEWQLTRYLEAMEAAGLSEAFLPSLSGEQDGRLWRSVPNRKWYSDQRGDTPGSNEVVLIHRVRDPELTRPPQLGRSDQARRSPDRRGFGSSATR